MGIVTIGSNGKKVRFFSAMQNDVIGPETPPADDRRGCYEG